MGQCPSDLLSLIISEFIMAAARRQAPNPSDAHCLKCIVHAGLPCKLCLLCLLLPPGHSKVPDMVSTAKDNSGRIKTTAPMGIVHIGTLCFGTKL